MRSLPSVLLLLGAPLASQAAITITITPGVSGTSFSVTQTAENPLIALDEHTVGYISGIWIAPEAVDQDGGSFGLVDTFSPGLGTLTHLYDGFSAGIVGFSFQFDSETGLHHASLDLDSEILFGASQSHRLQLSGGAASEIAINFSRFVPGTHVGTNPLFGEITTVVIPEPGSILLASIGSGLILLRRPRALPIPREIEQ